MSIPRKNSLVLYKSHAAQVKTAGDKLEIEIDSGKTVNVRPKDVQLLHPGPMQSLKELTSQQGDVKTAWELLAGETVSLADLADLIYETFTPATAWATWQLVDEDLYFFGTPEAITARLEAEVAEIQAQREAKVAEQAAWSAFLRRVQDNRLAPGDEAQLQDVVRLALNQTSTSRVLRELNLTQSPENAHALLLKLDYWDHTRNPYPERFGLSIGPPGGILPDLPEEARVDLTHLPAFAIDDEDSTDPDDALSLEGNRLWVHVADVAALIEPDSPPDVEARARGANLYLPEGTVHMLPPRATQMLGLGLQAVSPALSFGLDIDPSGEVTNLEIVPSLVHVERLAYEEVEGLLTEPLFKELDRLAQTNLARRRQQGAIEIDLPEVKVQVTEGQVSIRPLPRLHSRNLVREAMLLCGQALGQFARREEIPLPYTVQSPPDAIESLPGLAGMFAQRKLMKPGQRQVEAGLHAGLGLDSYVQATSPLRRYVDLVVHQQIRAYLRGQPLLSSQELLTRAGEAETAGSSVRQVERLANKHWTLVYLQQQADWQGEGVVIDRRGPRALILIPELDLDIWLNLPERYELNDTVSLAFNGIDLPLLDAFFRLER
jgi:exoribonuclease-2